MKASLFGSSGASLHTKALVIDGSQVFVGSYNLDTRSATLNCEQGILLRQPQLGELRWSDGQQTYDREPLSTFGCWATVWLTRLLSIESQL